MASLVALPVGALFCQRDSFTKEMDAVVVSCEENKPAPTATSSSKSAKAGAKQESSTASSSYSVVLSDTVLFPEGGGQPCDLGWIGDAEVTNVQRVGVQCVHTTIKPVPVGATLSVRLNWERRFDHMQQHSAQHIISGLAFTKFGWRTESWHLGEETSYIQFAVTQLEPEKLQQLETEANAAIRSALPVSVVVSNSTEATQEATAGENGSPTSPGGPGRAWRNIPEECAQGPLRTIVIEGLDRNMCCGTHITNTAQLQMIKFLHTEPKRQGILLHFVAGHRVSTSFSRMGQNERALAKLLAGVAIEKHPATVENMQKDVSRLMKANKAFLTELATLLGKDLANTKFPGSDQGDSSDAPKILIFHRDDVTIDFLVGVVETVTAAQPQWLLVLTCGTKQNNEIVDVQFLVNGPEALVTAAGPVVSQTLGGKGGGPKGKFRGKAPNGIGIPKLKEMIEKVFPSAHVMAVGQSA